jgi:hypothetical protein
MKLIPWILLNGSPVFNDIRERWNAMLNNASLPEEVYQAFLADHAGFFFPFSTGWREQAVVAKLQLANNHVTDFVVACNDRSGGFQYIFIELESPHTPPFIKTGNPSARLNTSVQQIHDWQRWLEQNRHVAKKLFPSKQFIVTDDSNFKFLIIIGRRDSSEEFLAQRNYYSQKLGIEIRSFDYITDVMNSKRFESFTWISHDLHAVISDVENNAFSNPFFRAYTDAEWRSIVNSTKLSISHMIGHNLSLLLEKRSYNTVALQKFMDYLSAISEENRVIPEWEYDRLTLT